MSASAPVDDMVRHGPYLRESFTALAGPAAHHQFIIPRTGQSVEDALRIPTQVSPLG